MRLVRFKHDKQLEQFNFAPRSANPNWHGLPTPPEEVPFRESPNSPGKGNIKLTAAYRKFTQDINTAAAFKAIMIPAAGWLNANPAPDTLSFAGNIGEVETEWNGYLRIKALAFDGTPPNPKEVNYFEFPTLVHKFGAVRKDGGLAKLAKGLDAYIPLLKRTELWIAERNVEWFPELPLTVQVTAVGVEPKTGDLHVRENPNRNAQVLGGLIFADEITLLSYEPKAGDVWAMIEFNGAPGYVCIQEQSGWKMRFHTTWQMVTSPPLP